MPLYGTIAGRVGFLALFYRSTLFRTCLGPLYNVQRSQFLLEVADKLIIERPKRLDVIGIEAD